MTKTSAPQTPTPFWTDADAALRDAFSDTSDSRSCAPNAVAPDGTSSSPRLSDHIQWDTKLPGFGLRTRATGHQTWVVQWRYDGHTRRTKIGTAPALTADEARMRAREYLVVSDHELKAPRVETFVDVFLDDCQHRWKPKTLSTNSYCLRSVINRYFGRRRIDSIVRDDVERWHRSKRGCNRSLSVFSSMMLHAELQEWRPKGTNPCANIPRKKSAFSAHKPTEPEYRQLGAALEALSHCYRHEVDLIRFLALTGMRRGESIELRWRDIEHDRAMLPDSKAGPKIVLLGSAPRALLDARRVHSTSSYVFGYDDGPTSTKKIDRAWRAVQRWLMKNHHATP